MSFVTKNFKEGPYGTLWLSALVQQQQQQQQQQGDPFAYT
jgi:hypothetical protein